MRKSEQGTHLSAKDVKKKVEELLNRRSYLGEEFYSFEPGYNPALEITKEFEALSAQTGVSVEALEFLHNPVGLVGSGARNLTRVEREFENLNVELAQELRAAGLL